MQLRYYIQTLGCQANVADSERVAGYLQSRGYMPTEQMEAADYVVVNTCSIRQSAEDRVLSLVNDKLSPLKHKNPSMKIVLTGCMVGRAIRDKTGLELPKMKQLMPAVDEFLPIDEVGFDYQSVRQGKNHAWVSISNGCNNFCSFCIVPYSRGREVSRPFADILHEVEHLVAQGYTQITLLGMNVNSYGADLLRKKADYEKTLGKEKEFFATNHNAKSASPTAETSSIASTEVVQNRTRLDVANEADLQKMHRASDYNATYTLPNGTVVQPVVVKHLGRHRIPTLFPHLLQAVADFPQLTAINFVSSNPWDFSDELIDVIRRNKNITRTLHIAVQAGDDDVLKRMNRWYTAQEFINLMNKIRAAIPEIQFTTDIIVGFPGETEAQFQHTVDLCKAVMFSKAYIAEYSVRPGTVATRNFVDDVPSWEKKRRFKILDELVNGNPHPEPLKVGATPRKSRKTTYLPTHQ